ncbi:MAG: type II toxin-antitoxin system PemK/MazF family toxin [Planctomycetota bacterium]
MKVQRGDVVFLRFPFSDGSGSKVRPAVVVQRDIDNQRLDSTVVMLITGNKTLVGKEPGHILIDIGSEDGKSSGLGFNSVVNVHALFTLHTNQIREVIGSLSASLMSLVDQQLRLSLDL